MKFHEKYVKPGLTEFPAARALTEGAIKPTFEVDDFVVQTGDRGRLHKSLEIYRQLQDTEVPVPEIVEDRVEGEIPYYAVENLPGDNPNHEITDWNTDRVAEIAFQAGKYLGITHSELEAPEEYGWIWADENGLRLDGATTWHSHLKHEMNRRIERLGDADFITDEQLETVEKVAGKATEFTPETPEPCLIHNDYGPSNIIVNENQITGVIDWDNAASGDPAYDYIHSEGNFTDRFENPQIKQAFKTGYVSEKGQIPENGLNEYYRFAHYLQRASGIKYVEDHGQEIDQEYKDEMVDGLMEKAGEIV